MTDQYTALNDMIFAFQKEVMRLDIDKMDPEVAITMQWVEMTLDSLRTNKLFELR